ncbi:haloacid dehalogenase superfamily, subfamily IA, variant 3 with third motif having DD or ED [Duganella sp. CF517]|uniref:HAD family hydrolase n=1 Tax=Duganella sp. CF517 TaxID=1881038 RepID=UPI0008B636D2|nr:HAD family phosphatase [Duganella sp. CF517]SEN79944.1 haloacid dehalogenase superfamily, subfamily IA, variant 3 with third motif having DD or ED [Duganella sp. CF517]
MLQAILWDNDGVLVDTERLFYEANRELFRPLGLELSEQHFFDWYLADNCGAWHLLEPAMSEASKQQWRAHRNRRYALRLASEHIPAIDGVAEVLARLAPRVRMGVVTSSIGAHFDIIHARLPLRRHFEFVLTHESYANSKPAPDPYLLGLERLGVAAADALVVEDSPRGLRAAMAAGIRCVVLRNALTRGYAFPGAYRVVDTMAELLAEIELLLSAES